MKNVICEFPGKWDRAIGHFDMKLFPGHHFVGADDCRSCSSLLLELGRVRADQARMNDVYLVSFDGEQAIREQSEGEDNLYGNPHLAVRWRKDATLSRVIALINADLISDKNLVIKRDNNSAASITQTDLVYGIGTRLRGRFRRRHHFRGRRLHPVRQARHSRRRRDRVDYPRSHSDNDTMDKLSAQSPEIVGTVMVEFIHRLEQ